MTCNKDMVFHVLYNTDCEMTRFYVNRSLRRLDSDWDVNTADAETLGVMFVALLDKDIELKNEVLSGLQGVQPMCPQKAERLFLGMRSEVVEPWLTDESQTKEDLLSRIMALYWSC